MADLNWQDLAEFLPTGSLEIWGDTTTSKISLDYLLERTVETDYNCVGEALHKLLVACSKLQVVYNREVNPDLNSYPLPTYSAPIQAADGHWYSTVTHTLRLKVKVDPDQINAVMV